MASRVTSSFDKDAAIEHVEQLAAARIEEAIAKLNALSGEYKGQPVDEVREIVARFWAEETGGEITEPELTEFAEAISEGRQIASRRV